MTIAAFSPRYQLTHCPRAVWPVPLSGGVHVKCSLPCSHAGFRSNPEKRHPRGLLCGLPRLVDAQDETWAGPGKRLTFSIHKCGFMCCRSPWWQRSLLGWCCPARSSVHWENSYLCQHRGQATADQVCEIKWNLSNMDILRTKMIVLISGIAFFQGSIICTVFLQSDATVTIMATTYFAACFCVDNCRNNISRARLGCGCNKSVKLFALSLDLQWPHQEWPERTGRSLEHSLRCVQLVI